jgi:hypothetical protein
VLAGCSTASCSTGYYGWCFGPDDRAAAVFRVDGNKKGVFARTPPQERRVQPADALA